MNQNFRVVAAAMSLIALAACGETGGTPEKAQSAAAPAAAPAGPSAAEIAAKEKAAALEAERAKLTAGLTTPFADEASWVAACIAAQVDAKICECAGKETMKTLGASALFSWVWEGYVNREGAAQMRSGKFFAEKGLSKEDQQKFADAIGGCYTY